MIHKDDNGHIINVGDVIDLGDERGSYGLVLISDISSNEMKGHKLAFSNDSGSDTDLFFHKGCNTVNTDTPNSYLKIRKEFQKSKKYWAYIPVDFENPEAK